MKSKGCLIALGVVGVIAVAGFIAINVFLSKAKDVVEGIAEGAGVAPAMVEQAKSLNEKFHFTPRDNDILTEDQVQKYIEIKADFADKIIPHLQTFKKLDEKSKKSGTDFSDIAEAWKTLGSIHKDFLKSLERHHMSPKEYGYLTKEIYTSYFAALAKENKEQISQAMDDAKSIYEQQMQEFDKQLQDPNLSDEMKESIRKAKEQYKTVISQSEQAVKMGEQKVQEFPAENIRLLNKYRDQLEKLNTFGYEFWGLALAEEQ